MVKLKPYQSSLFLTASFKRPLFDWRDVPYRFFEMLHQALSAEISITPSHFKADAANSLGDVAARYSVLGGPASISLFADRLEIHFPGIAQEESELGRSIIRAIDQGFWPAFPECVLDTVQSQSFEQTEIAGKELAVDYLERFRGPLVVDNPLGENAEFRPMALFLATAKDASWQARCSVEHSEIVRNGLFLYFETSLKNIQKTDSFEAKLTRFEQAISTCMAALDLEWFDAG